MAHLVVEQGRRGFDLDVRMGIEDMLEQRRVVEF